MFTKSLQNFPNLTAFNPNMFGTCSGHVRVSCAFSILSFFWHFDDPEGVRKVFGTCSGPVRVPVFPLLRWFLDRRAVLDWFGEV